MAKYLGFYEFVIVKIAWNGNKHTTWWHEMLYNLVAWRFLLEFIGFFFPAGNMFVCKCLFWVTTWSLKSTATL